MDMLFWQRTAYALPKKEMVKDTIKLSEDQVEQLVTEGIIYAETDHSGEEIEIMLVIEDWVEE